MSTDEVIISMLGAWLIALFIGLAMLIAIYAVLGQVFKKAGFAWWKAFIPFYNNAILFQIVGMNPLLVLLSFIPLVNIVFAIASLVCCYKLAKSFGLSTPLAIIGVFFPIVLYCIIAFVPDVQYEGLV